MVASNLEEFSAFIQDDDWNFKLFSKLFKKQEELNYRVVHVQQSSLKVLQVLKKTKLKKFMFQLLNDLSGWLGKKDKVFIIETYMGRLSEIKLLRRLVRGIRVWQTPGSLTPNVAVCSRTALKLTVGHDEFSTLAKELIPDFLPQIFVEGVEELEKAAVKMNWPAKPKLILHQSVTSITKFLIIGVENYGKMGLHFLLVSMGDLVRGNSML